MSTSADNDSRVASLLEKCCASCGIAEIDDIKLKPCPHCDLVEYCSDECQKDHREKHKDACKERAAELYDELLFTQPESSHRGDCPICCLPMPIDSNKAVIKSCCGKQICLGCIHADNVAHRFKRTRCPFCRHLTPETDEEIENLHTQRAKKLNDPIALQALGGDNHQRGDYERAFHFYSRAAALGDADSMNNLSVMHCRGEGVEEDCDKQRALLEKAAIAGHPYARCTLGCVEEYDGRIDRAVAHWIIAATLGCDHSIKALKKHYKDGHVSKDDFASALRAYQAAVDATKSSQREAAEAYEKISIAWKKAVKKNSNM